jgi:hypothetical protein
MDKKMYGEYKFIVLKLFSSEAKFNLESFFNIQLHTKRL